MYFSDQNILVDSSNSGNTYIIDLDTGFKAEYSVHGNNIHCWPEKIKRPDIEKARAEDKIDISRLSYKYKNFACKEVKDICDKIEIFLRFTMYPTKNIQQVFFNFI